MLVRPPGAVAWIGNTKGTVKSSKTSTCIRWSATPGNAYAAIPPGKPIPFYKTGGECAFKRSRNFLSAWIYCFARYFIACVRFSPKIVLDILGGDFRVQGGLTHTLVVSFCLHWRCELLQTRLLLYCCCTKIKTSLFFGRCVLTDELPGCSTPR